MGGGISVSGIFPSSNVLILQYTLATVVLHVVNNRFLLLQFFLYYVVLGFTIMYGVLPSIE